MHDLGRRHAPRQIGDTVLTAYGGDFIRKAGGYNKLCTARQGKLCLPRVDDGSGAHANPRELFRRMADSVCGAVSAEGDLGTSDTAVQQGGQNTAHLGSFPDNNHRQNAAGGQNRIRSRYFVSHMLPLTRRSRR